MTHDQSYPAGTTADDIDAAFGDAPEYCEKCNQPVDEKGYGSYEGYPCTACCAGFTGAVRKALEAAR